VSPSHTVTYDVSNVVTDVVADVCTNGSTYIIAYVFTHGCADAFANIISDAICVVRCQKPPSRKRLRRTPEKGRHRLRWCQRREWCAHLQALASLRLSGRFPKCYVMRR
jgi:hypothetical protein